MTCKIWQAGDKSQAICQWCGFTSTTFSWRDVNVGERSTVNVLVAVCDVCDDVVATPPQSTKAIHAAYCEEARQAFLKKYPKGLKIVAEGSTFLS